MLRWTTILAAVMALAIAGCKKSEDKKDSGTPSDGNPATVTIQSASGTARSPDGTWTFCFPAAEAGTAGDRLDSHTYAGSTLTITVTEHTSTDGSCLGTGTAVDAESGTGTVTVAGTMAIAGWSEGITLALSAPNRLDETAALPATPTVTNLTGSGTFGGVTVTNLRMSLFIDDTGPTWLMYRDHDSPADPCAAVGGYKKCLHKLDYLILQPSVTGITVQGAVVSHSLDGTWTRCQFNGSADQLSTFIVANNLMIATEATYPSVDISCTGTATPAGTFTGVMIDAGTKTISDWSDGSAASPTQPAAGGGNLPSPATVTKVLLLGSDPTRSRGHIPMFIDDTGGTGTWRLYVEEALPASPCAADSGGYASCLYTGYYQ